MKCSSGKGARKREIGCRKSKVCKHMHEIRWEKSRKFWELISLSKKPKHRQMDNYASSSSSVFPGCLDQQSHFFTRISNQQAIVWQYTANATQRFRKCRHYNLHSTDEKFWTQATRQSSLSPDDCTVFYSAFLSVITVFLLPVCRIWIDSPTWGPSTKPHPVRPWLVPVSVKLPLPKPWDPSTCKSGAQRWTHLHHKQQADSWFASLDSL